MSLNWIVEGVPRPYEVRRSRVRDVDPAWRTALIESLRNDGETRQRATAQRARRAYAEVEEAAAPRAQALTAEQLMTAPVLTLPGDAPLAQAMALMREREIRHVPVTDAGGSLIGMVSDRDLLRAGLAPASPDGDDSPRPAADSPLTDVMSRRVLTAPPSAPVRDVVHVMVDEHVSSIPVVEASGRLVGIITSTDILRAVIAGSPLDLWV